MTTLNDDRIVEIEIKSTYQEQTLAHLHDALVDKEKRITALEEKVERLERALAIVAQRIQPGGEVQGAHPEEDPVPRSG